MAAKGKRMAEEPKKHRKQEQVDYNKYQGNGEIPMSENDYKYGAYERNMERAEEYQIKRKKKMNKGLKIFLIILLVLVILIAAAGTAGAGHCRRRHRRGKWKTKQNATGKHRYNSSWDK